MKASDPSESPQKRLFALFTFESLLKRGLPMPRPLRRKLDVPPSRLAITLESLHPRERTTLKLAVASWDEEGLMTGLLTAPELNAFLDSTAKGGAAAG